MNGKVNRPAVDKAKEKALMDDIIQIIRTSFTWVPVEGAIFYGNVYPGPGLCGF
jgi:hypothetical protein